TANKCEFTHRQPEPIRTVTTFNEQEVAWAAEIINGAEKPLIYFGGGVRSAASCQPLRDLIHKAGIPATYTLMGAGVIPYGDPLSLGMIGMHGCYTANRAVSEADVVVAIGTRFSDRVALKPSTFAKKATIIQIDIDPSEVNKNVEVDLSVVGDAAYILQAMRPRGRLRHRRGPAPDVGGPVPAPRQEPRLHHQRRPGHHGLWLRRGHRRTDGPWAGPAGGHAHRRRLLPYESERSLHRRQ